MSERPEDAPRSRPKEAPGSRPGWYRLTWFLGRPPDLTDRQWKVLGLVAIVSLWVLLIFGMMGSQVTLAAFGAELFPTAQRSSASGLRGGATEAGAMVGLAIVSALFVSLGSNWLAVMGLAAVVLLFPLVVWLAFPETARRTLEEITPGPSAARPEHT